MPRERVARAASSVPTSRSFAAWLELARREPFRCVCPRQARSRIHGLETILAAATLAPGDRRSGRRRRGAARGAARSGAAANVDGSAGSTARTIPRRAVERRCARSASSDERKVARVVTEQGVRGARLRNAVVGHRRYARLRASSSSTARTRSSSAGRSRPALAAAVRRLAGDPSSRARLGARRRRGRIASARSARPTRRAAMRSSSTAVSSARSTLEDRRLAPHAPHLAERVAHLAERDVVARRVDDQRA